MAKETRFNLWLSHTKDSKNVTGYRPAYHSGYKVGIKGKVEQSRERSYAPPPRHLGVVANEKRVFG